MERIKGQVERVVREQAESVAFRELPPPPGNDVHEDHITVLLMYQYVEPMWTAKQHKKALAKVIALAEERNVTGRGRIAPEGLNCTLTGSAIGIRDFCMALRKWKPDIFNQTDFKLTDGCSKEIQFKALSLRKVDELVKYGLDGEKAPSISAHGGHHVNALEFHELMEKESTVIIDVRNHYETCIGRFVPPDGGADYIDPMMRTSSDFPKWLNSESTKEKLNGKNVLMYCTGGIRCERATALLNQFQEASQGDLKTKSVKMIRGGIERYLRTFPEKGGYWRGLNYLFDKRMEQAPPAKDVKDAESEALQSSTEWDCFCCICKDACAVYRGKYKCSKENCRVPVIVCKKCTSTANINEKSLRCSLCDKGFTGPVGMPDLIGQKRKLGKLEQQEELSNGEDNRRIRSKHSKSTRLLLSKVSNLSTCTKIKKALGEAIDIQLIDWLSDSKTGRFYGKALIGLSSNEAAERVMQRAETGIFIGKRKLKISNAPIRDGEEWPSKDFFQREFPPI